MDEQSDNEDNPDDELDDIGMNALCIYIRLYVIYYIYYYMIIQPCLLIIAGGGSRCHVSAREYYCFKLQIREGQFNDFFHAGRLFQQFTVDMYVKVESMHLDWYSKPAQGYNSCRSISGELDLTKNRQICVSL
jgi:hypothetical protein